MLTFVALRCAHQEPLFQLLSWLRLLGIPLPTPSLLSSSLFPTTPPLHIFLSALARVALLPLTLTATLYTGPLYAAWLEEELPGQKGFEYARDVRAKWDNVWGVRNYIVVCAAAACYLAARFWMRARALTERVCPLPFCVFLLPLLCARTGPANGGSRIQSMHPKRDLLRRREQGRHGLCYPSLLWRR